VKKSLVAIGLTILLGGCAVRPHRSNALVPNEIQNRTGHPMRPPEDRVQGDVPPDVDISDGVTEDEAVALALWNNAALSADLSAFGLAQVDLIDAGLLRNPNIQLLLPTTTKPF
jgi:cobalt-zinc-cadmium efflux system outer membrane protein